MAAYEEIGKAFASYYYTTMAQDKQKLQDLYTDASLMTFEGTQTCGKANIMARIMALTFKSIVHSISSLDCHPISGVDTESVLVVVMGRLKTDDDPPHSFSQTFLLKRADTVYYIANEVFRMVLHD